jgi:hypothetical protein
MSDSVSRVSNTSRPLPTASFALRPEQVEQIRKLAIQRNTSQSAIVREAVDLLMRDTVRQALEQLQRIRGEGNPLFPPVDAPAVREPEPRRRA